MTQADPHDQYVSPLASRYASIEMRRLWSARHKFSTWRRLWLALAESQHELGLDVTESQLAQLRAHLDDIDFDAAARYERTLRHDVMAHVHVLGDLAPEARAIIHLGATSQFVGCNTDLICLRDALTLIAARLARAIDAWGHFAARYRALPTLGFTHFQPAQPTTVGKRATLWAYDLALALADVEHRQQSLRFRGAKGATGTQASFLALFDGDAAKVEQLDRMVTEKMGWPVDRRVAVSGQTYSRVVDAQIVNALAVAAAAAHKCCSDIRLLSNRREIDEPFESDQIGSSSMPYKRNPMRCERACGLARLVMAQAQNPLNTAAVQWLERTLDDSSNRRVVLPEAFLALDAVLEIVHNVASGLVVYEESVRANLMGELPFLASENILMAAVQHGADRQAAHEQLRQHSHAAAQQIKRHGADNDILERLRADPTFGVLDLDALLDPDDYVGLAPEQVDRFIEEIVEPIRGRYAATLAGRSELTV